MMTALVSSAQAVVEGSSMGPVAEMGLLSLVDWPVISSLE